MYKKILGCSRSLATLGAGSTLTWTFMTLNAETCKWLFMRQPESNIKNNNRSMAVLKAEDGGERLSAVLKSHHLSFSAE